MGLEGLREGGHRKEPGQPAALLKALLGSRLGGWRVPPSLYHILQIPTEWPSEQACRLRSCQLGGFIVGVDLHETGCSGFTAYWLYLGAVGGIVSVLLA